MAQPTTTQPTQPTQTNPNPSLNGKTPPAPSKPGETQNPTPQEVRKMKLKLDGKDVEMTEAEVIARAQKSEMSEKRFSEAAQMRKQAEELLKFAKENPTEFFKRTGMNARQWAEEYLVQELKAEQMSPEQRKAAENEAKLRKYETEKKEREDKEKADERAKLEAQHAENYNKLFVEALTKSGLPKTAYTIKRMAELQLVNLRNKYELNPDQLAKLVREDYLAEQKSLFGAVEGDQLLELLGDDIVKKLSKAQIAKLKAKGLKTTSGDQNKPRKTSESKSGGMSSWREYQLRNRRRI